ncbi:hypothetical protein PLICRDRAFT_624663 [Plicaturopsis crispa FD-325 SS-3]|nr:hypothetical protein PLICRDRAFT_624663 [Plicaturopsis crispa FD-325 SS-3]
MVNQKTSSAVALAVALSAVAPSLAAPIVAAPGTNFHVPTFNGAPVGAPAVGGIRPVSLNAQRGLGSTIAKGAGGGAASAVLGQGVQLLKGLLSRDVEERAAAAAKSSGSKGSGIGGDIASSVAGGAANAAVTQGIEAIKGLFARELELELEARATAAKSSGSKGSGIGGDIASSVAGGAANAAVTQGIEAIKGLFSRELELELQARAAAAAKSSGSKGSGIGGDIASSVAGGAANAAVTQGIEAIKGLFARELELELEARATAAKSSGSKGSGIGGDIASSVAGGAANAAVTQGHRGHQGPLRP